MRAKQAFVYGFKMLLSGYFDGKMLIPCDMSLHQESKDKDYGLNKKEQKRQHKTTMPKGSCGGERFAELDEKKTTVFLKMLKRAVNKGFSASYVLMDSWFVNDEVIKGIRRIKRGLLHVVGICKMDRRKFAVGKIEYNSRAIIDINTRQGKIHNSKITNPNIWLFKQHTKAFP